MYLCLLLIDTMACANPPIGLGKAFIGVWVAWRDSIAAGWTGEIISIAGAGVAWAGVTDSKFPKSASSAGVVLATGCDIWVGKGVIGTSMFPVLNNWASKQLYWIIILV